MNFHDLVAMGNYGVYVWTAYGITLLAFGVNVFLGWRERKAVKKIIGQYLLQTRFSL